MSKSPVELDTGRGDYYQLTVSAGAGNSGGPVFDQRTGKVIGIFAASIYSDVTAGLAVPIHYGRELMGVHKEFK